jgi:predicted nucleotidyltransferase component of viral defense system
MTASFPESFGELAAWSRKNGIGRLDARTRLGQYAVLVALASNRELQSCLVMKGGNALDFVWHTNRSTRDLDFSLDSAIHPAIPIESDLARSIQLGFQDAINITGVRLHLNRIERNPKGEDKSFITFEIRIAYAMPDEPVQLRKLDIGDAGANVIPVEISINEVLCAVEEIELAPGIELRISTPDDIVAEKLRAILQQPIRNRSRSQDVFDIASLIALNRNLDPKEIGRFLQVKAETRGVPVSKAAFRNPEVARMARIGYEHIKATARDQFIEFDEAFARLIEFVDTLPIPEEQTDQLGGSM